MQTYRTHWAWLAFYLPIGCAICSIFTLGGPALFVGVLFGADSFSGEWWGGLVFALVFMVGSVVAAYGLYGFISTCYRIDLNDDGWCEFRSLFDRRRLRADEILSVKRDDDGDPIYFLRHQHGKLSIAEPEHFDDFLRQLAAHNPAVEIVT